MTVSGLTFIRYVQNQKIGKPNNLKIFESKKNQKRLNRIAKKID